MGTTDSLVEESSGSELDDAQPLAMTDASTELRMKIIAEFKAINSSSKYPPN